MKEASKQARMTPTPATETSGIPVTNPEALKAAAMQEEEFHRARNKTGVIGESNWHNDIKVNELWETLSVPEGSGKHLESTIINILI